ncbi:MAG: hypothetical protein FJX29_07410 [Alphaproteobacteria bacterium]|nr:hypothetical protein [Alphaproteobacteria bacterium]
MDLPRAIEENRAAIARILAGLFAMLGLADGAQPLRMPRLSHAAMVRLLRPAESAARRLIVLLARGLAVKARPPRAMPEGLAMSHGAKRGACFKLFDPRQRFAPARERHAANELLPRLTIFGRDETRVIAFYRERPPRNEDVTAAHVVRRLQALQSALANLPRQAKRLARALARRANVPHLRFKTPLRPGHPPGYRRKPVHEVDKLLRQCHWLARETLAPDTS